MQECAIVFRCFRISEQSISIDFERLFHLLSSFETDASSEFMIFITVNTTSFIQRHHASFNVMFVCALDAALILSAESDYVIKFLTFEALCDATVLLKQLACTFKICI